MSLSDYRARRFLINATAGLMALGIIAGPASAADWPHWRGPNRNGISSETGWLSRWPQSGPKRLWTANVGEGFSSVAIAGGRAYTMGNFNGQDMVSCLDAKAGKRIWKHSYACAPGDHTGPRATPTVSNGKVYTLSREGQAFCLDASSGKVLWQRNLGRDTGAQQPQWGFSGSPLIYGKMILYNVGSHGIALDKDTGKTMWSSGRDAAGYATPVIYTMGQHKGVAIFTGWGIVGVNPANGQPLWGHPWDTRFGVNAADPIFSGNTVFISSNYNRGAALLRLGGQQPSVVWENRNMRNHFSSSILLDGALYGNDDNTLKCIDLKTGEEKWRYRGIGKGGLMAADGKLIVLTERGELMLVQATPNRFNEISRAQVLDGICWTHPVLANGLLYCRNHEGTLICLDLRGK